LDPAVERAVVEECLEIAIQAPTGSNLQGWHFVVVTDAEKRAKIGNSIKKSWYAYTSQRRPGSSFKANAEQMMRVVSSARYLADHNARGAGDDYPCIEGRVENAGAAMQAGLIMVRFCRLPGR